ncbi:ATP-binding protein [Microcoleus sp. FACHB-672]|uniref:ATP-binding protein n=1 Tax=Microcoleus sp. FACHB-672 TaxID=2692825 RepID=UPI001685D7C1|nr:ATP-binding protein [Microcoleus sp. FACHB-672]MBD2039537.1 ATP-binding protein [Microcoleus sp. FACHB-672]
MTLDIQKFYKAVNPSKTVTGENESGDLYYIDLTPARGRRLIDEFKQTITQARFQPTCQLFTAHIGCWKEIELRRLQVELDVQGFHIVYCNASQDLELVDVDISDILLVIAGQVSESLEKLQINLQPQRLKALLKPAAELSQTLFELEEAGFSLSAGIRKITTKAKDNLQLRSELRSYLEPQINNLLQAINQELLEPATQELKQRGKKGLVVIVDNLERVDLRRLPSGRTQPEYLFIDRGKQLSQFHCHVIYTLLLALVYSPDSDKLIDNFGREPKVLPMVPVRRRDGGNCEEGMALLQQVVLVRAFPDVDPQQRLNFITEVFDTPETLNRLCFISGGHVRNLLALLYRCILKGDLPIPHQRLESIIQERCKELIRAVESNEWELLRQVARDKTIKDNTEYQILRCSQFIFEYQDERGRWFDVNPILVEAEQFKT